MKNPIKATIQVLALSLLVIAPIWVLAPLFGVMVARDHQIGQNPKIEHVIFDLGGVLTKTDGMTAFREIGLAPFLRYLVTFHRFKEATKNLMETLHEIKPLSPGRPPAKSPDGSCLLPEIFHEWLSNERTTEEILQEVNAFFAQKRGKNARERAENNFIHAIALMTFTPESLAKSFRPVKGTVELVKKCKKNGLKVYILSNFEADSYELVRELNPELFNEFEEENIFISGQMGMIKPDPRIYQEVLYAHNLDPASCVFIDDQKENIEAAEACGINTIWCKKKKKFLGIFGSKPNLKSVAKQLDCIVAQSKQKIQAAHA